MECDLFETVPAFPEFRLATLDDREAYNDFYSRFEPYSDFSFNNLWVWFNQSNDLAFSQHAGNLIIRINNPFDEDAYEYTLLGDKDCASTMEEILAWQKEQGIEQKIAMVPWTVVNSIGDSPVDYVITEDLDNRDYIYDVAVMQEAAGGRYVKYRHAQSYFKNHYTNNVHVAEINLQEVTERQKVIERLNSWTNTYRQTQQAEVEGAALTRLMGFTDQLQVKCMGLYMDGVLQSFAIYQYPPQSNFCIINHLKCNNDYYYIFDVTISHMIDMLHEKGIQYVNLEQDLGLPGLRTHKERLRPCSYLTRYAITP